MTDMIYRWRFIKIQLNLDEQCWTWAGKCCRLRMMKLKVHLAHQWPWLLIFWLQSQITPLMTWYILKAPSFKCSLVRQRLAGTKRRWFTMSGFLNWNQISWIYTLSIVYKPPTSQPSTETNIFSSCSMWFRSIVDGMSIPKRGQRQRQCPGFFMTWSSSTRRRETLGKSDA